MARASFTVAEVADLTGVSKSTCYIELERTGELLGVKCLKIRQRWVVPATPIRKALGIPTDDDLNGPGPDRLVIPEDVTTTTHP
jgi:hypothetical protein